MKSFPLLVLSALGVAMLTGYGLSAAPAQAGYVVTLMQQGTDVVATGSGPIDLTGLSLFLTGGEGIPFAQIIPSFARLEEGTN